MTADNYTLSLHDALPIYQRLRSKTSEEISHRFELLDKPFFIVIFHHLHQPSLVFIEFQDRKSTRLNSSHVAISYAVFCWKKKNSQNFCFQIYTEIIQMLI